MKTLSADFLKRRGLRVYSCLYLIMPTLLVALEPQVGERDYTAPKKWVGVHDAESKIQLGKSIYPDVAGKPVLDQSLAEFSGFEVIAKSGGEVACDGEWFEDRSSPYDAGWELYVFSEQMIDGRHYAKVRFCDRWAWVLVPKMVTMYDLAPEEVSCYQQRQREKDPARNQLSEPLSFKMGVPRTITEKFSVTGGNWNKRIDLSETGILKASIPNNSPLSTFNIALESTIDNTSPELFSGISGLLEVEKPFEILLAAGVYRIQLQEDGGEGDYAPPCPPNERTLTLVVSPPPAALNLAEKIFSPDSEQPLVLSFQRQRSDVLLTRLSPTVTLSNDLKSVALISIEELKPVDRVIVRVRHGQSDMVEIPSDQQRLLAGPGNVSIEIHSEDSDNWKLTDGVLVSFVMSTLIGNSTERLFEPTSAPGLSYPGPTVQFRNVSGLDFSDVEVEFDYRQMESHYKGIQNVPTWKKKDVHNFQFSSAKNQPLGMEHLRLTVKAINGTEEISFSLRNSNYPSMEAAQSWVPSSDYDEKIKLRVWKYCAKLDPNNGEGFETCQDRWLREEITCYRLQDPRTPAFITCVRDGIAKNFPELLPHIGH